MPGLGEGAARTSSPEVNPAASDRYQIFASLGRGGMADVYLAVARGPRDFSKLVVLKRLRPHLADEPSFREMFLDEARLAARLNHPNVVSSYEVGEGNGSYFIAMEYLDGQSLDRILLELQARGERIDPALAARVVSDACSGLAHAHELRDYDGTPLRIIHRDVSPHNLFVGYDGQVKLVDFGIAKAAVSRARTDTGVLKGKIAYMPPEQAAGGAIDARADIFAIGIVLWELLAGRQLFPGDNAVYILRQLMSDPIPTPSSVLAAAKDGGTVDPKLERIVMRALEKEPDNRFQTARELRGALEEWIVESGHPARREDVGALVTSMFEAKRARVQDEIQKHMAALRSPSAPAPGISFSSIDRIDSASGSGRQRLLDLRPEATDGASGLSRRSEEAPFPEAAPVEAPKPAGRASATAYLIALLVLAGIAIVFLLVRGRAKDSSSPTVPSVRAEPLSPGRNVEPTPQGSASATSEPLPPETLPPEMQPPAAEATRPSASSRAGSTPGPLPSHPAPPRAPAPATPKTAPSVTPTDAAPGFLTLDTYPWTRVSESGRVLGTTPLVHVSLSPGAHVLSLDNADLNIHQTYTATITSGATVTRSLGLR